MGQRHSQSTSRRRARQRTAPHHVHAVRPLTGRTFPRQSCRTSPRERRREHVRALRRMVDASLDVAPMREPTRAATGDGAAVHGHTAHHARPRRPRPETRTPRGIHALPPRSLTHPRMARHSSPAAEGSRRRTRLADGAEDSSRRHRHHTLPCRQTQRVTHACGTWLRTSTHRSRVPWVCGRGSLSPVSVRAPMGTHPVSSHAAQRYSVS